MVGFIILLVAFIRRRRISVDFFTARAHDDTDDSCVCFCYTNNNNDINNNNRHTSAQIDHFSLPLYNNTHIINIQKHKIIQPLCANFCVVGFSSRVKFSRVSCVHLVLFFACFLSKKKKKKNRMKIFQQQADARQKKRRKTNFCFVALLRAIRERDRCS